MLQTKLNDLSRNKKILMSQRSKSSTKNEITAALNAAVKQMSLAANTALDGALVKLEKMNEESYESLSELARRIAKLFTEVKEAQDIYASLKLVAVSDNKHCLHILICPLPTCPFHPFHPSLHLDLLDCRICKTHWRVGSGWSS